MIDALRYVRQGQLCEAISWNSMRVELYPIGTVKSSVKKPTGCGSIAFQEKYTEIEVYEQFSPGLKGIEQWDQLWVLFWMHRLSESDRRILQTHPMGDVTKEKKGVFALRSPMRPNPIGLTKVKLVSRKGNVLVVEGLDAADETPILDIKPCMEGDG